MLLAARAEDLFVFRSEPVVLQVQALDLTSVPSHQLQGVLGHGCLFGWRNKAFYGAWQTLRQRVPATWPMS